MKFSWCWHKEYIPSSRRRMWLCGVVNYKEVPSRAGKGEEKSRLRLEAGCCFSFVGRGRARGWKVRVPGPGGRSSAALGFLKNVHTLDLAS